MPFLKKLSRFKIDIKFGKEINAKSWTVINKFANYSVLPRDYTLPTFWLSHSKAFYASLKMKKKKKSSRSVVKSFIFLTTLN